MRSGPRGFRRSVDRGAHRPAIEPRKIPILGADAVQMAEGNTSGRVIASVRTTRRGQRPWHVQTLLARELRSVLALSPKATQAQTSANPMCYPARAKSEACISQPSLGSINVIAPKPKELDMSRTQARREMSRLDVIRFIPFSMLLILPATSGAHQPPPIAEQMPKPYGLDSFGQIEAIPYT